MKRSLIITCLVLIVTLAFAQKRVERDPSYSTRNYKHANKASFAKRHKLDKAAALQSVLVQGGPEYKHRYNQSFLVLKGAANTAKPVNARRGYKHPLGL